MENCLFVYGTLLPGLAPPDVQPLIQRLQPLGPAGAPGRLYDLGEYPGAIFDPSSETRIAGYAFALPNDGPALLEQFDAYEGFLPDNALQSLFVRVRQTVTLADGRVVVCWAYHYNRAVGQAPLVADGDYVRRRR